MKVELTRQLKLCLDAIADCIETIEGQVVKPISYYEQRIITTLLTSCFDNNDENLQAFLDSEQSFSIETVSAQFVSENLDGFLGHHARIAIPVPNQKNLKILQFSPDPDDIDKRSPTQRDVRHVRGKKLVEMIALHEQLLITEPCPELPDLVFSKMKIGERDCLNYVNKILVGTNQKVTSCRRFDGSENWVGRNIIGFFVQKLSPFSQGVLDPINESSSINS
ncbi:MAG: hypothetical protein H0U73_03385 [Tatlockia sp.]|nr:hypothetical protein [Tatlockia sp.]